MQTYRLAAALASRGAKVVVVTGRYKGRRKFQTTDGLTVRRVFVGPYVRAVHELFFQLSFLWYLIRHRDEYQIIQLSHSQLSSLVAVLVGKVTGKPVVTRNSTAGTSGDLASWASVPFGRSLLRFMAARVDAAVAVSKVTRDEFLATGVPERRIWLIENGVEIPDDDNLEIPGLREKLGLKKDTFVVVFAGRLSPIKAPADLLDAWMRLAAQYDDTQLVFLGEGELAADLQAQVARGDQSKQVLFPGRVANVNEYLLAADAFVLPSISEAMPNALLEAMATGLPVIASAVGGTLDVIEHRQNGLLYTSGDVDSLTRYLLELANSSQLRVELGVNARRTIIARFSLKQMTDKYIALYNNLLDKTGQQSV